MVWYAHDVLALSTANAPAYCPLPTGHVTAARSPPKVSQPSTPDSNPPLISSPCDGVGVAVGAIGWRVHVAVSVGTGVAPSTEGVRVGVAVAEGAIRVGAK